MSKKTSLSRGNNAVQGTNDSSIVSKCSMAARGYFHDPYLQHFVAKARRRAPLINRGYYVRAKAVDHMLRCFINQTTGKCQILSLGAGFDSAYFRLKADGMLKGTMWIEVDFLESMQRKAALINNSQVLTDLLGPDEGLTGSDEGLTGSDEGVTSPDGLKASVEKAPDVVLSRPNFKLLGVDLRNIKQLENCLRRAGVDLMLPTLLLSECVMTYIKPKSSSAVIKWAAETFPNAVFVTYEQILPNDAFGMVMLNHFHTIGSSLRGIQTYPDRQAQERRYKDLGWSDVHSMDMNQFYVNVLSIEERQRVDSLEPFDEYEEWHLKCSHYLIVCAYRGSCSQLTQSMMGRVEIAPEPCPSHNTLFPTNFTPTFPVKRFGHVSLLTCGHQLIVHGGFGEQGGQHKRLGDLHIVDLNQESRPIRTHMSGSCKLDNRMFHTATQLSDGKFLIFGGRLSPTQPCQSTVIVTTTVHTSQNIDPQSNNIHSCVLQPEKNSENLTDSAHKESESTEFHNNIELSYQLDLSSGTTCAINMQVDMSNTCSDMADVQVKTSGTSVRKRESCGSRRDISEYSDSHEIIAECSLEQAHLTGTTIPCPRWRHSANLVKIEGTDYVFVFGGKSAMEPFVLGDCFLLDVSTLVWTKLKTTGPQPSPRHSHTCSLWRSAQTGSAQLVIACGLDKDMSPLGDIYLLDLETLIWKELVTRNKLHSRYSHTAHVVGDQLILVGGVGLHTIPGITVVKLETGEIQEYMIPVHDVQGSPLLLYNHSSHLMQNSEILVLGGGGNCFSFGTHFNDQPLTFTLPIT